MPLSRHFASLFASFLMAPLMYGCGGVSADLTGPPPLSTSGTGTVAAAGGSISLGSEAGVTVPPGAVDTPLTITIERVATPADLQAAGAIGQAYRFTPAETEFRLPVKIFVFVPDAILAGYDSRSLTLRLSEGSGGSLASEAGTLTDIHSEAVAGGIIVRGLTRRFSVISAGAERLPVADAGPDRTVSLGATVEVTGVGSDPDGGSVAFAWSILRKPPASAATLAGAGSAVTRFTPDVAGEYVLALTVTKPGGASTGDEVTITAVPASTSGTPPAADAGSDRLVPRDSIVRLDGSASSGTLPLSFSWRFLTFPGVAPLLIASASASPSFTPRLSGTYVLEVTVANPFGSTTDVVTITVNTSPVPELAAPDGVKAGEEVTVVDTSSDADGDPLVRSWFFTPPGGSTAGLVVTGDRATFTTDVTGYYTVGVTVSDGKATVETSVRVAAVPDVSGTYDSTFRIDPAPACGVEEAQTFGPGALPIVQDQDRVTFQLEAISAGQASDATGPIGPDGTFDFTAPMRFVVNGTTHNASPRWTGTFGPSGELDARFSVNAFLCTITGTVDGVRQ
ncbi:hypothetical protein BH18GEM1_BH18GEM1_01820 [soil metagenome]